MLKMQTHDVKSLCKNNKKKIEDIKLKSNGVLVCEKINKICKITKLIVPTKPKWGWKKEKINAEMESVVKIRKQEKQPSAYHSMYYIHKNRIYVWYTPYTIHL